MTDLAPIDRRVAPAIPQEVAPISVAPAVVQSALDRGRAAQAAGDLVTAERNYREVLGLVAPAAGGTFDPRLSSARYNLATTYRDQGRLREAAETIAPLRRTRDGRLNPDAEVHAIYADIRIREGEALAKAPIRPERVAPGTGPVVYDSPSLAALREGARAVFDMAAVLNDASVRAALGEQQYRAFAQVAATGLVRARSGFGAAAGAIQQANRTGDPEVDIRWVQWLQARQGEMRELGMR